MLLTSTINAVGTTEMIACVCVSALQIGSANSARFADWQPAHQQAKRRLLAPMRPSGYPDPGQDTGSMRCCSRPTVSRRSLIGAPGCVAVS